MVIVYVYYLITGFQTRVELGKIKTEKSPPSLKNELFSVKLYSGRNRQTLAVPAVLRSEAFLIQTVKCYTFTATAPETETALLSVVTRTPPAS